MVHAVCCAHAHVVWVVVLGDEKDFIKIHEFLQVQVNIELYVEMVNFRIV